MSLEPYTKQQLSDASRDAITEAMQRLPIRETPPQWLCEGQKYSDANITADLETDYHNRTIENSDLVQRIAAGIPSHVLDGWSCLGRAIHCLIRGDARNAIHLGYYAELRAALAIVASEGIAIFDQQHFIVHADGTVDRLCSDAETPTNKGTHAMIWPVYEWWIDQRSSIELITSVIKPGGQTIKDWFASPATRDIYLDLNAKKWLDDWGLDIRRMTLDHGARNASSYGPSAIHGWKVMLRPETIETLLQFWRMFEPKSNSRFDEIDRLLLKQVLVGIFKGQTRKQQGSRSWNQKFGEFISDFLDGRSEDEQTWWKTFFVETASNERTIPLEYAAQKSPADAALFPVEMLSRAALLLRIATGSCGLHLNNIGVGWDSLEFWLEDIGTRRGFWKPDGYPEDPIDLWSDISDAIEDLETTYDSPLPEPADSIMKLEECERIGLWGFGV